LLALPVHVLVVIYSLGRGDLLGGLGPFRDAWRREDLQAAAHVAKRDLDICADSGEQLLEQRAGASAVAGLPELFCGDFLVLRARPGGGAGLSPVGAGRKSTARPRRWSSAPRNCAMPSTGCRYALLAASLALVGNFVAVSRVMLHELLNWNISAAQLINRVGLAAGENPPPVVGPEGINTLDCLWELLLRAAVLWYAGFALVDSSDPLISRKKQKIAACDSSYKGICVSRAAMSLTLSYKTSLRFELYRDGAR
jgi:AmpE protein